MHVETVYSGTDYAFIDLFIKAESLDLRMLVPRQHTPFSTNKGVIRHITKQ
jgi:hypothetical protein